MVAIASQYDCIKGHVRLLHHVIMCPNTLNEMGASLWLDLQGVSVGVNKHTHARTQARTHTHTPSLFTKGNTWSRFTSAVPQSCPPIPHHFQGRWLLNCQPCTYSGGSHETAATVVHPSTKYINHWTYKHPSSMLQVITFKLRKNSNFIVNILGSYKYKVKKQG